MLKRLVKSSYLEDEEDRQVKLMLKEEERKQQYC
jgi:hypothetical protein